jgi:hypothetical protein
MTTINLNEIESLLKQYDDINKLELHDLTFQYNGKPIHVPQEHLNEWQFMGLNNITLIRGLLDNIKK